MRQACIILLTSILIGGCQSLRLAELRRDAVWPRNAAESGLTNGTVEAIALPLTEAWSYNANAGFGPGQPIVLGDVVLVVNRKGEVHAIDRISGKKVGVEKFGDAINGTPTLTGGVLFIPLDEGSRRSLNAWDLVAGTSAWSIKGGEAIAASIAHGDDRLFVVDRAATITALQTSDGVELWKTAGLFGHSVKASPIMTERGHLVVASIGGEVVQLSADDGAVLWSADVGEPVYQTPATSGNVIVVTGARGRVVVLDAGSGAVVWSRLAGAPGIKLASPAVEGEFVAVTGTDGQLLAMELGSGREVWKTLLGAPVAAPPLVTPNLVFVGTLDSRLIAVDRATGGIVWEEQLRGRMKSAMTVDGGDLFVVSEPRFVYRFESALGGEESINDVAEVY